MSPSDHCNDNTIMNDNMNLTPDDLFTQLSVPNEDNYNETCSDQNGYHRGGGTTMSSSSPTQLVLTQTIDIEQLRTTLLANDPATRSDDDNDNNCNIDTTIMTTNNSTNHSANHMSYYDDILDQATKWKSQLESDLDNLYLLRIQNSVLLDRLAMIGAFDNDNDDTEM